jgi:hypothetical protein
MSAQQDRTLDVTFGRILTLSPLWIVIRAGNVFCREMRTSFACMCDS